MFGRKVEIRLAKDTSETYSESDFKVPENVSEYAEAINSVVDNIAQNAMAMVIVAGSFKIATTIVKAVCK